MKSAPLFALMLISACGFVATAAEPESSNFIYQHPYLLANKNPVVNGKNGSKIIKLKEDITLEVSPNGDMVVRNGRNKLVRKVAFTL